MHRVVNERRPQRILNVKGHAMLFVVEGLHVVESLRLQVDDAAGAQQRDDHTQRLVEKVAPLITESGPASLDSSAQLLLLLRITELGHERLLTTLIESLITLSYLVDVSLQRSSPYCSFFNHFLSVK